MLHGIEVYCEFPSDYTIEQIRDHVDQWARRYQRRLTDQQRDITEVFADREDRNLSDPDTDPPRYLYGIWRFDYGVGRTDLVRDVQRQLRGAVAWYIVRAHECDHEEDDPAGCTDVEIIESGSIPEWVARPGSQPGEAPPWDRSPPPTTDADDEITAINTGDHPEAPPETEEEAGPSGE